MQNSDKPVSKDEVSDVAQQESEVVEATANDVNDTNETATKESVADVGDTAKVDAKTQDEDMQKHMVSKSAKPLKANVSNDKAIKKVEEVKARVEKKLAEGPSSFNKQVIHSEFYRDNFRMMVKIALVNSIVMVAIIMGMIFYMFRTQPDNRFFATTVDGRIMQLIPLDMANMTRSELYSWVVQAVNDTLTFGYHDYQRRLQDSTHYFTRDGWESFAAMLQNMHIIDTIGKGKLVVKAEPRSAPELEQEAVFNGRYRWVMNVDFRITMQGKGIGSGTKRLPLRLTIERVPVLENINGVAIKRWDVLSPY